MSIIVDFQPVGRKIEITEGSTILKAAQSAGIGLNAICGGQLACGSCLVRLGADSKISPPTDTEQEILSQEDLNAGYRLACQTRLLESAVIDIPPESLSTPQRTQVEGDEADLVFEPSLSVIDIQLTDQDKTDSKSDWDKVNQVLSQRGFSAPQAANIKILRRLSGMLRSHDWNIRIVVQADRIIGISAPNTPVLGMAIDIGTTKIAGYLVDLTNGKTLAKTGIMNPQIAFGEDVMARIAYTMESEAAEVELQLKVVDSINDMASELCREINSSRDSQEYKPSDISEMVVVGNTVMHHLFLGLPVKQLGMAPYLLATSSPLNVQAIEIGIDASPGTNLHLLPNIAGFVGADHVSMLLATEILGETKNTLYIDIGTNTEITLLYKGRMISCSAASGPAFEGAHIHDGMRAADGAIERVRIENNQVRYQTINNAKPVGICGSGIIDAIAQMLSAGILNRQGAFNLEHPLVTNQKELILATASAAQHQHDIIINRKDVSEIQLAKGAIRAAIELMMKKAGAAVTDIEKVNIAGAFGSYIDVKSAIAIGILPDLPLNRFKQVGNAAGIGAKQSLLSVSKRREASEIAKRIEYLELSTHADFSGEFAKAMSFS